jgi:hypothetical protein
MSGAQQGFFEFDPSLPDYMRALLMKVEEVDWHKSAKS